jgi:hypothetical protein
MSHLVSPRLSDRNTDQYWLGVDLRQHDVLLQGRSLKDVETVTNIQGGIGNPQSEYTGLGFNIYATNETSPFAVRTGFFIAPERTM